MKKKESDYEYRAPPGALAVNQAVELEILDETELGYKAIIDDRYVGLIYRSEISQPLEIGRYLKGWVKAIRADGKIDLSITRLDHESREDLDEEILRHLRRPGAEASDVERLVIVADVLAEGICEAELQPLRKPFIECDEARVVRRLRRGGDQDARTELRQDAAFGRHAHGAQRLAGTVVQQRQFARPPAFCAAATEAAHDPLPGRRRHRPRDGADLEPPRLRARRVVIEVGPPADGEIPIVRGGPCALTRPARVRRRAR